mgnify:CR=1 FL=1
MELTPVKITTIRTDLALPDGSEDTITPDALRAALDASGIVHRVVVISACYSGGFVPALKNPDTLVLTAARPDRPYDSPITSK